MSNAASITQYAKQLYAAGLDLDTIRQALIDKFPTFPRVIPEVIWQLKGR